MKKILKGMLRFFGLMGIADRFRFFSRKLMQMPSNKRFRKENPEVVLPPDYLMYESFMLDYHRYYFNGRKTCQWVLDLVAPHHSMEGVKILDWGCGPGRVIRHMPELLPDAGSYAGTDYNEKSIHWCSANLKGIQFSVNGLNPPLGFEAGAVDFIYGISIFTHLSEEAHILWLDELYRVLSPGGILLLTLHGEAFIAKLGRSERALFMNNQLVVRGQVKEGHRTFIAFHPPTYVRSWAEKFRIAEHIVGSVNKGIPQQDVWILKKPEGELSSTTIE